MKKLFFLIFPFLSVSLTACYGPPHAEFEVKGKVVDENNIPIHNICIATSSENGHIYPDTVYTDAAGLYSIRNSVTGSQELTLKVTSTDIDGEENGGDFIEKAQIVDIKSADYTGAKKNDSWHDGKATKIVNFRLEKNENP